MLADESLPLPSEALTKREVSIISSVNRTPRKRGRKCPQLPSVLTAYSHTAIIKLRNSLCGVVNERRQDGKRKE